LLLLLLGASAMSAGFPATAPAALRRNGTPIALASIEMIDARHGYALGWRDRPPYRLLRTDDGARSWRDITPANGRLPVEAFSLLDRRSIFASATVSRARGSLVVVRSDDGGKTWLSSPFHDPRGVIGPPVFVDQRDGFVGVGEGVAAGSMAFSIWRTRDGGHRWSLAARTPIGVGKPGALPFSCDKNGLTFINPLTGWVSGECAGGPPYFYATHDAGRTWHRQALPGTGNCQCSVEVPRFFDQTRGAVQVGHFAVKSSTVKLYWTLDGGRTWRPRTVPGHGYVGTAVFADSQRVWIAVGDVAGGRLTQLLFSQDAGAKWRSTRLPFNAWSYLLDFVSARLGFAVRTAPARTSILETRDGGLTWQTIRTTLIR
jgi:photosystem II stability/assembly factor-like uncharacterized protein